MHMNGNQLEQLCEALLDAYPTRGDLERMVTFCLGANLNAISGEGSLSDTVFRLITWARATGHVDQLVEGAWKTNSSNSRLNAFIQAYRQGFEIPGKPSETLLIHTSSPVNLSVVSPGSVIPAPTVGEPSNSVSVTNLQGNSPQVRRVEESSSPSADDLHKQHLVANLQELKRKLKNNYAYLERRDILARDRVVKESEVALLRVEISSIESELRSLDK